MEAYDDMMSATSTPDAPWYVVPADNKWFTRLAVAAITWQTIADLDLRFPKVTREKKQELQEVKRLLLAEKQ
jgi:polyphosphate kinase 2 PPK2